ncbi:MAG: hypothetical protein LUC95_03240 [Lachnospiraceae bacterium]|nr:hypothetical protein [Lachnospiraceae bacterium]
MSMIFGKFCETWKKSPVFRVFFVLETLLLLLLGMNCVRPGLSYVFSAGEALYASGDYVRYISEDGEGVYYAYLDENIAETTIAYTDDFSLYPGAYRITIYYEAQVNYEEEAKFSNGNGYLYLNSTQNTAYYQFDEVFLRNGQDCVEQTVQVTSPWTIGGLNLSVTFYGLGSLTVSSIEVTEVNAYRYLIFLGTLLLFGLFDLAYYLLFVDLNFSREKELGALMAVCAAAVLPFLADWVFFGENTALYAYRILLLEKELSNGNFFPAVYSAALNGYGYASPLFEGQLFWYFPALLYHCGFSLTFAYHFYLIAFSVGTCLITYYCGRRIFRESNPALLAAALYTLNPVRLTNILTRADLDIVAAQTFLPLLVLGLYQIYFVGKGEKITVREYWPAALGMTAVIAAHRVTAMMTLLLIFAFCLIRIRKTVEKKRVAALCRAAALTLLMSLAVWAPAFSFYGMDLNVAHTAETSVQSSGAYLVQLFNAIVNNYQASNAEGTASNELSLSIGFSVTLGLVLFIVYCFKVRKNGCQDEKNRSFARACWGLAIAAIFMSTVYMCYDYLDFLPGWIYSLLTAYEYPWRWLSFAVVFGAFGTAAVVQSKELGPVFYGVSVYAVLCVVLTLNTGQIYADQLRTSQTGSLTNNLEVYNGQIGDGEYLAYLTDTDALLYRELLYDETVIAADSLRYEENHWLLSVQNTADDTAILDIPVLYYRYYTAYDADTGMEMEISAGENNRIRLHVPAGYSGTVEVKYQIPLSWRIMVFVSLTADLCLVLCLLSAKKHKISEE